MIGLYFGGQWFQTTFGNQYGNIELDLALDEVHEWTADATTNPVEEGAPVADHIIEQSDKLKLTGFVTDAPLAISPSVDGVINNGQVGNRTQPVFDLLYRLIKAKEPVAVYTKHRLYLDMVLTNINIPRNAGVGEAIEFTAEFIHIRKVATQMVDVPKGINPKKSASTNGKKTEAQKDSGKKQTQPIPKPSSTLARIFQ